MILSHKSAYVVIAMDVWSTNVLCRSAPARLSIELPTYSITTMITAVTQWSSIELQP
jgi:hypothetical protein